MHVMPLPVWRLGAQPEKTFRQMRNIRADFYKDDQNAQRSMVFSGDPWE